MGEKKNIDTKTAGSAKDLPSPHSSPNADLVIYDGDCNFCSSQVKNLSRLDGKNRLAFISLHDPFVTEHFTDLTHQQLMQQMYLIPNRDGDQNISRLDWGSGTFAASVADE